MLEPAQPRERIIAAMSGGVDSSVAAARLVAEGFEVIGVTLHLWDYPEGEEPGRCCAPEDQHDARNVADRLGIPHYTFDRRDLFRDAVVNPFVEAYASGETPSPCVQCNRSVKLRELFAIADRLGARRIATGHYARVERRGERFELLRGVDRRKDQSYFLHTLVGAQELLSRLVMPLGASTKPEVRDEALALALPGATKGESQELCFVSSGRYDVFVAERAATRVRPGNIVDASGRSIGVHDGLHRFTIGQRKGLGAAPRDSVNHGRPMFVVGLDAETNTVRTGDEEALLADGAVLGADELFAADVEFPRAASVQVRARHQGADARVERDAAGRLVVRFDAPVRAVSPGQIAVLYDGERALGGAPIRSSFAAQNRQIPAQEGADRTS
ncbi:MAG: tRNA 2-thiouridine(34) synthase MnmA [Polyangiaceae bacterium]